MRPAPLFLGLVLAIAGVGCGRDSPAAPVSSPSRGAEQAGLPAALDARLKEATARVLKAIDSHDDDAFAAASIEVGKDGARRRLSAADVKDQMEALHVKYGERPTKVKPYGGEAPPVPLRNAYPVLVWFGEDEDLVKFWFVEESGSLLLARVSEEDPASHPSAPK